MQSDASPACKGSGFIGMWGEKKAVYKVPSAVTNGHDNAVRQGLASPFLCLTSLDGVYAPILKRARQALCANSDPVRQQLEAGGSMPADPLYRTFQHSHCGCLNPPSRNLKI